jgi:uncharacterized protein YcbK (DUF882 family)
MSEQQQPWRLIAPAEDPTSAREISDAMRGELEAIGRRLGLRVTRDDESRKLYLGLPKVGSAVPVVATSGKVAGVVYPSGNVAARSTENNDPRYAPARPASAATLVKAEPDVAVSQHFRLSEFRPWDASYTALRVHPDLIEALERIRARTSSPITVTSGYRPPAYNRAVGGEARSYHQDGLAADIYCDALSTKALYDICNSVIGDEGGVGYYPTQGFVHVDVRGYRSRW